MFFSAGDDGVEQAALGVGVNDIGYQLDDLVELFFVLKEINYCKFKILRNSFIDYNKTNNHFSKT